MKFKKKAVMIHDSNATSQSGVVDAFQWKFDTEFPSGVPELFQKMEARAADGALVIKTADGNKVARSGDWIIRDENGEFYSCNDAVFKATYDAVK